MKEFIEFIAKHLVDSPEDVIVEEKLSEDRNFILTLRVKKEDAGKVIGKKAELLWRCERFLRL